MIRDTKLNTPLIAVSVVTDNKNIQERKQAGLKNLENAAKIASATDVKVTQVSRYDLNICSGIVHAAEEYNATNLVIGLHWKANIIDSFFGNVTASLLKKTNREIMVARYMIPPTTVRKIHVAVPPRAEYETGFVKWIEHIGRMASQLGCKIAFYAAEETLAYIKEVASKLPCRTLAMYTTFDFWNEFNVISEHMDDSHLAVVVCARKGSISYDTSFERLPSTLNKHLQGSSLIVIYPEQFTQDGAAITFSDPLGHNESQHYEKAREWVTDLLRLEKEDNK
jgi:hypothetical protein